MAAKQKVKIDRQVDATEHGQDAIDALNAQDKVFLKKYMITVCAVSAPRNDDNTKVKMDATVK